MLNSLNLSLSGTYTGSMLVQHYAGYIPEDEEVITPQFFDANIKISYDVDIAKNNTLQINAGVKNIFNSFQKEFDQGANRDAGFIYGPGIPRTVFVGVKMSL
jgi:outer membrane receptor for ferrienterochelin and colicins